MSAVRARKRITGTDLTKINDLKPFVGVNGLNGVRVYHVGQGDCIAVLDNNDNPILQIDVGGKQSNPLANKSATEIDKALLTDPDRLVMLTHWDEDHWCTAAKADAIQQRRWLVPRQITSPRAVDFSAQLGNNISCIPENRVAETFSFQAKNSDKVLWEKIDASPIGRDASEDCNKTGVAFSVVKKVSGKPHEIILIPGDAPYEMVRHYHRLLAEGTILRGIVAFHHGAATHWTDATRNMLSTWRTDPRRGVDVVFSFGNPNRYSHPHLDEYITIFGHNMKEHRTPHSPNNNFIDVRF